MSSDKSAIERLRALLTERGVEWWQSANTLGCVFTRWYSPLFGDEVCAMENGEEGLVLFDHFVTPEQAVEATLGNDGAAELQTENAKLRELVADIWEYVKDYADALDAEVYVQVWPTVKHGYGDKVRNGLGEFVGFPDRMRELGVEVDV